MPRLLRARQEDANGLADSAVTITSPTSPTTTSARPTTTASTKADEEEDGTKTATPARPTTSRAVVAADTGTGTGAAEPTASGPGAIEQLGNAYDSCEGATECSQSVLDWASENTWIAAVAILVFLALGLATWLFWHRRRKHKRALELEEKKASVRSGSKSGD